MKTNEGILGAKDEVLIDRPMIDLIDVEVQHPTRSGDLETRLGTIGAGVVMQPNGNPRILLDVRHPDDTALAVILNGEALHTLIQILFDANNAAAKAQRNSIESTRQ